MDNFIVQPTNVNLDRGRRRKVVFYGRVSTEHEAQISALQNQLQWYDDQAKYHTNWNVLHKYIDEGITGTQAKKRPAFLQMIADAKSKKFDLIVTREVCRFARNTVDTLVVTRELKALGVEVYFVEDNIWTMDGDGELRLTIMATLAQEESRKVSERVRAGQKISRDKGVLYGSGNILGYDRDKLNGTYIVNPEQAETVRIIYDLYQSGMGMTCIRDELIKQGRKDSSGLVRWEISKISRILHNKTYCGYKGYLKSYRNNFLEQKIIKNHDESTYLYVKGDFEPIISEEQWESCKRIRDSKIHSVSFYDENGEVKHTTGVRMSDDIWVKKMKCRCGCSFRRNKWRKNSTGELVYGYKCYQQINYGKVKQLKDDGYEVKSCDLRELPDWKIDMMARHIFRGLWGDNKQILLNIGNACSNEKSIEDEKNEKEKESLIKQKDKLETRLKKLLEMRMEDEISKDEYREYRDEIDKQKGEIEKRIIELNGQKVEADGSISEQTSVEEFLNQKMDFSGNVVDRDILQLFVKKVIPRTETEFEWYLDFGLIGREEKEKLVWEFTIEYDEALGYKHERDGMLRRSQWTDLKAKVYI